MSEENLSSPKNWDSLDRNAFIQPSDLSSLKARLHSFQTGFSDVFDAAVIPTRLAQIQEDLVELAGWGSSPNIKQIEGELRQVYKSLVERHVQVNGLQPVISPIQADRISPVQDLQTGRPQNNPWGIYLKALGLALLPLFGSLCLMGSVVQFVGPSIATIGFFLGYAGSFILFFRIVAPGFQLWPKNWSKSLLQSDLLIKEPPAGRWLGILAGVGTCIGVYLFTMGLVTFLSNGIAGFLFIAGFITGPVLGVALGRSVARQPLGR